MPSSDSPESERKEQEDQRLPGWEKEIGSDRLMSLYAFGRAVHQHGRADAEQAQEEEEMNFLKMTDRVRFTLGLEDTPSTTRGARARST